MAKPLAKALVKACGVLHKTPKDLLEGVHKTFNTPLKGLSLSVLLWRLYEGNFGGILGEFWEHFGGNLGGDWGEKHWKALKKH